MKKRIAVMMVVLLLMLNGCAAQPAPTEAPQSTVEPTAAVVEAEPTPTEAPEPTAETPQATENAAIPSPTKAEEPTVDATAKPAVKPTEAPKPTAAPTKKPEPTPTPAPTEAPVLKVTISIDCSNAVKNKDDLKEGISVPESGVILGKTSVTIEAGESAFDVLKKACSAQGIQLKVSGSGSGVYVQGIGGLREFDCGRNSGWIYTVNGTYMGTGCGNCKLTGGENIRFVYTCASGSDI